MNRRNRFFATIQIVVMMLLASTMVAGAQQLSSAPGSPSTPGKGAQGATQQSGGSASPLLPTGTSFTYQGKLTNGGTTANGQYDFNFTLWDTASGGVQVGPLVGMSGQPVTDGLFTISLDFGTNAFQGSARWLEIQVRQAGVGAYTTLTPRQQLSATPYALSLVPGATINGTLSSAILSASNSGNGHGLSGSSVSGFGVYGISNGTGVSGEGGTDGVFGTSSGSGNGVRGTSGSGFGVYGSTGSALNSAAGVYGISASSSNGVYGSSSSGNGVYGTSTSSNGVSGNSTNGTGVRGASTSNSAYGVWGSNTIGIGTLGTSNSSYGLYGTSNTGTGVYGGASDSAAYGVEGSNNNGTGVYGHSNSGTGSGVRGYNAAGPGVYGTSINNYGVYGTSSSFYGVYGTSNTNDAVVGHSNSGDGMYGVSDTGAGVNGYSGSSTGVIGNSGSGHGVDGFSTTNDAIYGNSTSGKGMWGNSTSNFGVYGTSNSNTGVSGASSTGPGVYGSSNSNTGVVGGSTSGTGIYGFTTGDNTQAGVLGKSYSIGGNGIIGKSNSGIDAYGVWGKSTSGYAGYFSGNVHVSGTLSKSAGSFKIDDPIDPANKYLSHSFVESPDMMNIYNGNVTTNANGEATITMPAWFEALNQDFRYQLTIMGDQFAQARVSSEMKDNHFAIKTDKPGVKVSWQVTGIRHDAYAQAHRIPVEQDKASNEKGYYLNPEVFGQSASKAMENSRTDVQGSGSSIPTNK